MVEVLRFEDEPFKIMQKLHERFTANFDSAMNSDGTVFTDVELRARATVLFGKLLAQQPTENPVHQAIPGLYYEVFADTISSIYLASLSLNNPAKAMLRRAMEVGIATVYLWDLPHEYVGWAEFDKDLSFSQMIDHLDDRQYRNYIGKLTNASHPPSLLDASESQRYYRTLSNTIHGKLSTFEAMKETKFTFSLDLWSQHLLLVRGVQAQLFTLWKTRFPTIAEQLITQMPRV